jgi:hypothetical protein
MPRPLILVLVALALLAAAFFSYSGHPVMDSNLYSPSVPGWISVGLFILIGVFGRIIHVRDQRRDARKTENHESRKT